ncbi:hypothetical protein NE236_39005 [Actinoallomurus purpureus]|uniref:hypothetical protein n=1 Tax=Actinoallomurus purpureus TaxID=478114 RepID=UPI0020930B86|nr:hypothetical protein [Actinoallomurus purpureus]MCO6010964.1 hypothetical protein [Actinoallomurus purpureus]
MRFSIRLRHVPGRLATGIFILDSGLNKRGADQPTAEALHGMAANAYPFLRVVDPKTFVRLLSASEMALGTALLLPVVPTAVAGAALTAFSAGLVGLYARTPGMRREGSVLPSQQGIPQAKDAWLLGIGLGFVVDGVLDRG